MGDSRALRWIKPREAWLLNRAFAQGGELVDTLFEGISQQVEAAARATSLEDLFRRLNATGQMLRVDESVTPTMFKGPTASVELGNPNGLATAGLGSVC